MTLDFGPVWARWPDLPRGSGGTLFPAGPPPLARRTGFGATDSHKIICNTRMKMDPPQPPAAPEGVPFAIAR